MAESKRSPRWRYLGAAGGVLGALVVIFALLTAPAPVQPVHRVSLKSEDVGSQTATTPTGSKKTATDHTVGTTTTHGETSTTSNPLARASHAGAPSSGTTTSSTAAHAGAIGAALGASGGGPGTTTSTAAGANPASECSGTTPPVAAPAGGWQCTFDDEFNGTSLDTSKWQPQLSSTSGYSTGAAPDLVCYVDNPQTISESGGTLNLSVVQTPTPQPCGQTQTQYEGGMVSSYEIFSQRYGFFEARAKLPASDAWTACRKRCGSIPRTKPFSDRSPTAGRSTTASSTRSSPPPTSPSCTTRARRTIRTPRTTTAPSRAPQTAGQFNTYALLWTPTTITAYFNGMPCITDTYAPYVQGPDAAPGPFNQPFFMAFTAALGVGTDSPEGQDMSQELPATTSLDWMRVWQYG